MKTRPPISAARRIRFPIAVLMVIACSTSFRCNWACGQSDVSSENEVVDRFWDVLLRRPRPGIALDRIYSHHVQNGSVDTFLRSLDRGPTEEQAGEHQMIRGLIQLRRGQSSAAVDSLRKADRLLPADAMSSYYFALALQAAGNTDEAVVAFQRSIDRKPSRREAADVYFELSHLQTQAKKTQEAIATLASLQERFPGDQEIGQRIARTLVAERLFPAALDKYSELADSTQQPEEKIHCQIEAAEIKRQLGDVQESM
ncbi:MAG: tetratricopeptide repeat protein, partial [Planctomycetales bacterium]|nr:tetratricopeptide repeat protein [Planctomycetales bacterium]